MNDFLDRWMQESDSNARLVAQEMLIAQVTERVWGAMEKSGIKKSDVAAKLGVSKGYVSQVLSGSRNMTLRTLADLCYVLGAQPSFSMGEENDDGWHDAEQQPIAYRPISRAKLRVISCGSPDFSDAYGCYPEAA